MTSVDIAGSLQIYGLHKDTPKDPLSSRELLAAPSSYRALLRVASPSNPEKVRLIGKIHTDGNEGVYESVGRSGDSAYLSVRFVVCDQQPFDSHFSIELKAHTCNKHDIYEESLLTAIFNENNLHCPVYCAIYDKLKEDDKSKIRSSFNIDPCQKAADGTLESCLTLVRIKTRKDLFPPQGINFFNNRAYRYLDADIEAVRNICRSRESNIELAIPSLLVAKQISACNQNINLSRIRDPVCRFFFTTQTDPDEWCAWPQGILEESQRPRFRKTAQITYKNSGWWSVDNAYGAKEELALEDERTINYSTSAYILPINGAADRRYGILIKWNKKQLKTDYNPRPGDNVRVTFNSYSTKRETWPCRIAEQFSLAAPDEISAFITHPYAFAPEIELDLDIENLTLDDKSALPQQAEQALVPKVVPNVDLTKLGSFKEALAALKQSEPVKIVVRPDFSTVNFNRQCRSIATIVDRSLSKDFKEAEYYGNILNALRANNPSQMPPVDLFEGVENALAVKTWIKEPLNDQQRRVVDAVSSNRGPIMLVNGPPGCGKTESALRIAAHLSLSTAGNQVLLTAPTNTVASNNLEKQKRILTEVARSTNYNGYLLCIRVYTAFTEDSVFSNDVEKVLKGKKPKSYPEVIRKEDKIDTTNLQSATELEDSHKATYSQKFEGIDDGRVTVLESTLGHAMKLNAGLIKMADGSLAPFADPKEHRKIAKLHRRLLNGEVLDMNEEVTYKAEKQALCDDTLRKAHVVSTTLGLAGGARIYKHFRPSLVIVDEASNAMEMDTVSAIAFYQPRQTMLLGDPCQLKPLIVSGKKNRFNPQMELSLFTRLYLAGLDTVDMYIQHRYCKEIKEVISQNFYKGLLEMPAKEDEVSPEEARGIHKDMFGICKNVIVVDIADAIAKVSTATLSSANLKEVKVAVKIMLDYIERGVKTTDIGIITPYQNQYDLIRRALKDHEYKTKSDMSGVLVAKFDSMAGGERRFLIVSMTATHTLGFLEEKHRINSAFSRAKDGLVILANVGSLSEHISGFKVTALGSILFSLKEDNTFYYKN